MLTKSNAHFLKIDVLYLEIEAGDWRSAGIHRKVEGWTSVEKIEESPLEAWTCFQHQFVATGDVDRLHQLSVGYDTLCTCGKNSTSVTSSHTM